MKPSKRTADFEDVARLLLQLRRMRDGIDRLMGPQNNIRVNEALESISTHVGVALDSIGKEGCVVRAACAELEKAGGAK